MSGYPGAPPFGGQYSNVPFGTPFPPNFAFNNMIPPPAPSFGHQQASYPPNQILTPGQIPYGNAVAYQNNAQYHQQQLGQVPFPPQQAAPFYPPFGSYNNHNPYVNPYNQSPFAETAVAQQTQNGTARGQPPQLWNTPVQDPNKPAQKQTEEIQANSPSRVIIDAVPNLQQDTLSSRVSPLLRGPGSIEAVPKDINGKQVITSSNETTPGQTPIQPNFAISGQLDSGLKPAINGTRKSSTTSDQSFDPYSGNMSQTPGESADVAKMPSPLPSPKNNPASTLPGLEPDIVVPSQLGMEITREQKKTLAIQAIQDLASRKIGFDQISKEGINLELLKDLYLESGVPLVLPTDVQNKVVKPVVDLSKKPPSVPSNKKTLPVNADIPTITAVPNFNLPIVPLANTISTKLSAQTTTTNDTSNKVIALAKDSKERTSAGPNPIRQDYLAKLQSAKEAVKNKANPPPGPSLAQERSNYLAKLQAAKEAVKQSSTQKPSQSESQTTNQQAENTPSTLIEASGPKPENNPVQTRANIDALLRQKLEALRRTQSSTVSSLPTPPLPSAAPTANNLQPLQEQFSTPEARTLDVQEDLASVPTVEKVQDTEVSFFVPGDMRGLQGLPGLPGLTTDPPPVTLGSNNHQPGLDTAQIIQSTTVPALSSQTPNLQASSETKQSRKRPVASDFNESPPPKLRRVSAPEPASLVIEISEDEGEIDDSNDLQDNLSHDTGVEHGQPVLGNLPTRPELPTRSTSYNTPIQTLTPDLQAKEDAIRELKQRIVAATLRKTAKTTTETPTASKSAMPLGPEIEQAQRLEDREAAIKIGTQELTSQEKALAAAKLQAQKHLEQIRRNQASLNAHANKTQQDADNANNSAEREQRLRRKADLEAKLSTVEAIINTTEADLALIKQEQDKLLSRIQQESQARSILMDELKELLEGLEKEVPSKTADAAVSITEPTIPSIQPNQNNTTFEIPQAAYPGPEKQLDFIPSVMADSAEQSVQVSLSSSNVTSSLNSPHRDEVSSVDKAESVDEDGEEQMDIDNDSVDSSEDEYDPEKVEIDYHKFPEPEIQEVSDEEPVDYVDEYEPVQNIEVLPVSSRVDTDPEHQDLPTSYQNIVPVDDSSAAISISPPSSPYGEQYDDQDVDNSTKLETPEYFDEKVAQASAQTARTAQPSTLVSDVGTPMDNAPDLTKEAESTDILTNHTDEEAGVESEHEMVWNSLVSSNCTDFLSQAVDVAPPPHQHFVPYESPLAQFNSYRFHPQFSEIVTGGFRSLTYNHKINPNVEFCKWELAGRVCDDLDCNSQHFKDITLTGMN